VLILCEIPWFSGLSHYALDVAEFLRRKRAEVCWAAEKGTPLWKMIEEKNFRLIPLKSRRALYFFHNLSSIKTYFRDTKPSLILSFTGSGLLLGAFLKRFWGPPLFRFRTESPGLKRNLFNKKLYGMCDGIVAGNKAIREEIVSFGFPGVRLLYAGVDLRRFSVKPLPSRFSLGYLGRLDRIKGLDVLWKAMNIVWQKNPDLLLRIAGKEEYYKWEEIRSNFRGPVEYMGFISSDDVPGFLSGSTMGIVPSTGSEATSRVLLEWRASGRGVIASRVGMLGEVIEEGKDGILVSPGDHVSLADSILRAAGAPSFSETAGRAGRMRVEEEFSIEAFEDKLEKIIGKYAV